LRAFGQAESDYIDTDQLLQAVPSVAGYDVESVRAHFDRLVEVGLIHVTREIQMRHHPDPVTWRATEIGRGWVWRAWSDHHWLEGTSELERLLGNWRS
jgi:hypothetical protein